MEEDASDSRERQLGLIEPERRPERGPEQPYMDELEGEEGEMPAPEGEDEEGGDR